MPTAVFHPGLTLGIDGSRVRGRRDDLAVLSPASEEAFRAAIPDADVLVVSNAGWDDAYLDGLDAGDWVQSMSAGYDRIPVDALAARDVTFSNSTVHGPTIAEHVFALLLALTRRLPRLLCAQRDREWARPVGRETTVLHGRTLAVLGLGTIGEAVAARALAFDLAVHGLKRDPDAYGGSLPADRVHPPGDLEALLPETDALVVAVPLTDETAGMVDAAAFEAMPDRAVLVNVARGGIVDEDALVAALDAGALAGAGLDVFEAEPLPGDSPLWDREDVIVTPHVAMHSDRHASEFAELFLANYDRWRRGEPPTSRIA